MGLIGNDIFAEHILRSINSFAIDAEHLYQVDEQTAHHFIYIDEHGELYFKSGA
jgi:sugar/nucleoside kinase (ribokinase family)